MENRDSRPPVTVITSTYRRFDSVYRTIDSMLRQDYGNLEYILTDDGSDGFPEQEIREYLDAHGRDVPYRIIHHPQNLGTVRNLDNAYREANGKYIVNLSAGDVFVSGDTVSRIVDVMERRQYGALSTSRLMTDEAGRPLYFMPHRIFRKRLTKLPCAKKYRMFVAGQFYAMFSGSALAVRKDVYERLGGYDGKYRLWEDGPFVEKALREGVLGTDYTLTTIGYEAGGVSTGKRNPLLEKDVELYNRTDRIAHLSGTGRFYRTLTALNVAEDRISAGNMLRHPAVMGYKLVYRLRNRLGMRADRAWLKRNRGEIE